MESEKTLDTFPELRHFLEKFSPSIESSLREFLPVAPFGSDAEFQQKIDSKLLANKNQLRATLTLLGAELFGGHVESILPAAVAVEYLNVSCKIFNEIERRISDGAATGKATNDGENDSKLSLTVAIALLNAAYPLVFVNHIGMPDRAMHAHQEIVECVSSEGLVGSLHRNSTSQNYQIDETFSDKEPKRKSHNPAFIRLSLRIGAVLAGADYLDLANISRFAEVFSDSYQISIRNNFDHQDSAISDTNPEFRMSKPNDQARLNILVEEAKRLLVENFPSNRARSCLIQLTESLQIA